MVLNLSRSRAVGEIFRIIILICGALAMSPAFAKDIKIVAFGDSLSAGFLLPSEDAFPVKLQKSLRMKGHDVTVVNASVSGDTSTGGLARLDWSTPDDADAMILELGANDALRGIDPQQTRAALEEIAERMSKRKVKLLICGMLAPPNLGVSYAETFNPLFKEIADKYDAVHYPFFLDGVASVPELNLPDGMHPTAKGIDVIVERILPYVEQLIAKVKADS